VSITVAGVTLGRMGGREIAARLERAAGEDLTYDHVGSTLADGTQGKRSSRTLGQGDADFDEAVARLRAWGAHRGIGAVVHPAGAPLEEGLDVVVEMRRGPVAVVVPCRVVQVVDEPGRLGFAYGTLPGHVEKGEESFLVEKGDDGTVTGTVTVDAALGTLAAKLAAPMVFVIQRWATKRYLSALVVR
jgi:uncharacterized protein (UPF0548 family)